MPTTLQMAGAGMQAYSQYKAGDVNAYLANQRALMMSQQAVAAVGKGATDVAQFQQNVAAFKGRQEAAIGASGVQRSGSPLRLLEDTAGLAAADIERIRNNAAMDAWGYRTNAATERFNGSMQRSGGIGNAVGSLLMGGARAKGLWGDDAA